MIRPRFFRLCLVVGLIGTALGLSLSSVGATSTPIANSVPQVIQLTNNVSARLVDVDMSNDGLTAYTVAFPDEGGSPAYTAKVIRTTDGGLNWSELDSPVGAWKAVSTSSDGEVVAVVGDVAESSHRLFVSADGGDTWTQTGPTEADYVDVAVSGDGGTIVVTRVNVGVSYSHDGGDTWTAATVAANTSLVADDVAVNDDGNIMVASRQGGSIWRSTNGGATWIDLLPPRPDQQSDYAWQDISISDDGLTVFGVVFEHRGYVWDGRLSPAWIETPQLGFASSQSVRGAISPDGNTFMATSYGVAPRILRNWDRTPNGFGNSANWATRSAGTAVLGLSVTNNGARFLAINEMSGIWLGLGSTPAPIVTSALGLCQATATGPAASGGKVKISGDFLFDPIVTIGGRTATISSSVNRRFFEVDAPPGTVGPADIVVSTPGGSHTIPGGFVYRGLPPNWSSLGSTITGDTGQGRFGTSIASSADGSSIAVGSPYGGAEYNGRVQVYDWNGTTWNQRGSTIEGSSGDQTGQSIALSADGNTLAVGAPFVDGGRGLAQVYRWNGTWIQVGDDITSSDFDTTGSSIALSANGNTLAVGAPLSNSGLGRAQVYTLHGNNWIQRGNDITISATAVSTGTSVALNAAGDVFAVGAPEAENFRGVVAVFGWDGATWARRGSDIAAEVDGGFSGHSVGLSAGGDTIAVGAPGVFGQDGRVRVYDWNGQSWSQYGPSIFVETGNISMRWSVALSPDGNVLAHGQPDPCVSNPSGSIAVRDRLGGQWILRSTSLDLVEQAGTSTNSNDYFFGVALDSTGDIAFGSHSGINDAQGAVFAWRYTAPAVTDPPVFVVPPSSAPSSSTPSTPTPAGPPSADVLDELPVAEASSVLSGVVSGGDGPTVLRTGAQVGITLDDFTPDEDVWIGLFSEPTTIATVKADANGVLSTAFTVPSGLTGDHTLVIYGTESGRGVRIPVRLTPPAIPTLPVTGSDLGPGWGPRTIWPLTFLIFGLSLVFWVHNWTLGVRSWTQNAEVEVRRRGGRRGTWRTGRPRRP